jgi:peptidoglycan hydrolase-like protein with peptidoglycan-binding domain
MKEKPGGGVYEATLDTAVKVCIATCRALGIQLQMPKLGTYTGHPIPCMSDEGKTPGGPDTIGIFGHRDNTERRGRWDPGEAVFQRLAALGVEQLDFAAGEDREVWASRQRALGLPADGIPGPGTVAALKAAGYTDGIWALGKRSPSTS